MAAWQSSDTKVNAVRLHSTRTGGDKPQVALAHGFSDDSLCWTALAEALEGNCEVNMVDARGQERSGAGAGVRPSRYGRRRGMIAKHAS